MDKKKKNKIQFIIFILCVLGIILINNLNNNETEKIFNNAELTIGEVNIFYPYRPSIVGGVVNNSGQSSNVEYTYLVKGVKYDKKQSSEFYTPQDSVIKGQKYLVVYYKNDPKLSRILFDSPIRDSVDFKKYLDRKDEILVDHKHNKHVVIKD